MTPRETKGTLGKNVNLGVTTPGTELQTGPMGAWVQKQTERE